MSGPEEIAHDLGNRDRAKILSALVEREEWQSFNGLLKLGLDRGNLSYQLGSMAKNELIKIHTEIEGASNPYYEITDIGREVLMKYKKIGQYHQK